MKTPRTGQITCFLFVSAGALLATRGARAEPPSPVPPAIRAPVPTAAPGEGVGRARAMMNTGIPLIATGSPLSAVGLFGFLGTMYEGGKGDAPALFGATLIVGLVHLAAGLPLIILGESGLKGTARSTTPSAALSVGAASTHLTVTF